MSVPTTTKLIFWADQCRSATNNTLSTVNGYNSIFINLLSSPTGLSNYSGTTLTLPYTGGYLFEISGWRCGAGTSQNRAVVTRGGTTIYQRIRTAPTTDCSIWMSQYFWHLFQVGDVVTFSKSENNGGTVIGTTTSQNSASDDTMGPIKIWFIPS